MLSIWEKQSFLQYDIIIIGSGIVGLSAAISIKERDPKLSILVLEKGILPTGASTKNAGFACIGSLTEILDDLSHMPQEEVLQLVDLRRKGLQRLRNRLGDEQMGYQENGSYELITAREAGTMQEIDRINSLLFPILGKTAFETADNLIPAFGFNASYSQHLIRNTAEGELDTGSMMKSLIHMAITTGIEIKTGCDVLKLEENSSTAEVWVGNPDKQEQLSFKAKKVIVCTNAFTRTLFPAIALQPGRGQVLITPPIDNIPFKGIFHFDKGYYYFRRLGDKVLFGGGRHLDIPGETTTEPGGNELIRRDLLDKLNTIILPGRAVTAEYWWSGVMAFGPSKFPIVKAHSDRIFLGVRMGGMGIAIGSEIGEQLAGMVLENN